MAQKGENNQNRINDPASLQCIAMCKISASVGFYENLCSLKGILPPIMVKWFHQHYNDLVKLRKQAISKRCKIIYPPQLTVFSDTKIRYPAIYDYVTYIEEYIHTDVPIMRFGLYHRYCRYCWQQNVSKFLSKEKKYKIIVQSKFMYSTPFTVKIKPEDCLCERCNLTYFNIHPKYNVIKHSKMYRDVKAKYGLD